MLTPQAGTRTLGHNVKAGYYSQYRVDMLHPERTVLEEAFDTPQRLTETIRAHAARLLPVSAATTCSRRSTC